MADQHELPSCTAWAIYTRDARRYRVPSIAGGYVELEFPVERGDRWRFPLLDLSWGGVAFELCAEIRGFGPGLRLPRTLVCVGRTAIVGELTVLHLSPDVQRGLACGGRFVAAPEAERELASLLRRLEHVTAGAGPRRS